MFSLPLQAMLFLLSLDIDILYPPEDLKPRCGSLEPPLEEFLTASNQLNALAENVW